MYKSSTGQRKKNDTGRQKKHLKEYLYTGEALTQQWT